MAAQNNEEDRDLDDPDFKSRKDQDEERGDEQDDKVEPGQQAAERLLKAQQAAAQREREEETMEQEAQARAHQMMVHQSSLGSSASQLARQLSGSIEDKNFEAEPIHMAVQKKSTPAAPV